MEAPSFMLLLISILSFLVHTSISSTVVVNGVTKWTNPTAYIGDFIIFKHKYEYELYIFKNSEAFKLCDFSLAILLSKPNSTSFTVSRSLSLSLTTFSLLKQWYPSRPGYFYFSFSDGSSKPCQNGQKLAIKVVLSPSPPPKDSATSPNPSPPTPSSAGSFSSSPAYPWPFQPKESLSPNPSKTEFLPTGPTSAQRRGGLPFINSNPVVPFPTGEVDSAMIRPVPISHGQVVVGFLAAKIALCFVTFVLLLLH